jgi:hypothetical protein
MPESSASSDDQSKRRNDESNQAQNYDHETVKYPGMSPSIAEAFLRRLGGGVAEKHRIVEGVGFRAAITPQEDGVSIEFAAHEELLDDLIRRFEDMANSEA